MNLDLTPDETSLLTGILVIWKTKINKDNYEDLLIGAILQKIFDADKEAVETIVGSKR